MTSNAMNSGLIVNATIVTMGPRREIVSDGALAWSGGRILAVGKGADLQAQARYANFERVDAEGGLLVPGFVDAHNHSAHFLTKGLLDDCATERRWKTRLYPFECSVSEDETYRGSTGTFAEQLLHGTTCVGEPGNLYPYAVARAAQDIGMRVVLTGAITDTVDPLRPLAAGAEPTAAGMAAYNDRLHADLDGAADGRVRVAFGLWTGSTVSDELCVLVRDLAERRGAIVHGHLATRESDNLVSIERFGVRAVERYRRLGLLGPNFTGAHAGAINDEEVEVLARTGSNIIHCPSASMLGGFGCITHGRFPELSEAGVNLAIGSDAASISRFLDMPRLMYLAACAHKDVRRDAEVMGAHRAFEMATIGGARALGLQDEIGSLEAGKRCDFALLRTDGIEWQPRPRLNPVANLVYSSGGYRTRMVVVDGRVVVKEGRLQTRDLDELLAHAREAARTGISRARLPEAAVWPIV